MKSLHINIALFLIRLALGVMYLTHGLQKLLVETPTGTASYFESIGFPAYAAYLTIVFEIGGGAFLIIGIFTRLVSFLAFLQMIVICFVHAPNGWPFQNPGGGWEYPAFMCLVALSLTLLGSGKYALLPNNSATESYK